MINIEEIKQDTFIGIPSLSRPEYITTKTMKWLKDCGIPFKIFVEPQERFLYKQYNGDCIVELPESGQGLMYSLNYIRQYASILGYKYLFQLDDDVDGFVRTDVDEKDFLNAFYKTIDDCRQSFIQYPNLGGIRFTQYRFWVYSKKNMHKWTHLNRPLQGICMLRLAAVPQINPKMKEFTDTLTSLYIWKNGYVTLNYGLSGLKVVQNANKGGCQTQDRASYAEETIKLLKKDFPKVTQKEGSSWFKIDVDISHYMDQYRYAVVNGDDDKLLNKLSDY